MLAMAASIHYYHYRYYACKFSLKYQPSGAGGTRSPPATPQRLQRRTTCKIQSGRQGAPKWPTGSVKMITPRFLGVQSNFGSISFLIRALLL